MKQVLLIVMFVTGIVLGELRLSKLNSEYMHAAIRDSCSPPKPIDAYVLYSQIYRHSIMPVGTNLFSINLCAISEKTIVCFKSNIADAFFPLDGMFLWQKVS